jgi:hypothetical protein
MDNEPSALKVGVSQRPCRSSALEDLVPRCDQLGSLGFFLTERDRGCFALVSSDPLRITINYILRKLVKRISRYRRTATTRGVQPFNVTEGMT